MAGQLSGSDSTIAPANINPQVLADQVDLSQRVQALALKVAAPGAAAAETTTAATAAISPDNLAAPAGKWDKFVDITEKGVKEIPSGIKHAFQNPLGLIENAGISVVTGMAAKVLLPETGPLGSICAVGLGLYFGEQTALPIYRAYSTGLKATTMGGINKAGAQVGDAVGGLVVNAPIGYAGYKLGARLGDGIMASPKMAGYVQWKADTLNPINDSISSGIKSAKAGIASGYESSKTSIANAVDRLRGRVEINEQPAEIVEHDSALQYPKLPDRYAPIQEKFSGQQVTGISREFLKNLDVDNNGDYYGAGLRYPDIMADPAMKAYIEAQNKLALSRINPAIYQEELAREAQTGGAFGKLPDGWDNGTAKSLNAIDVTDGGDGSMSVGGKTYTLTDDGAPYRKLVVSDGSGTRTLIPETKGFEIQQVIASADGGDKLAVVGSQDGASALHVYDGTGKLQSQVPLPGYGTLHDVRAGASASELQFLYDTPISPPQALTLDLATNKSSFSQLPGFSFPTGEFVTEKLMVPYKDINGNMQTVPAFLSYAKDMAKNGQNPSVLSIYGGFDVGPQYLKYMANSASLLENGFVTVDPVLPGDGGLGSGNYNAGLLKGIDNNVLALSAIIEKLHELGYSSPDLTGIYGRSNGGAIVGTMLNNRPDLIGAAVPESGVHSLFDSPIINPDTGKYWEPEFGNPKNAQQVAWMHGLDVLTNLSKDKKYPATLVMQGTLDGVVNVGNSTTYAAIRQGMNNGETLLYSRIGEGHDPTSLALQTAFLRDRLSVSKPA